MLSKIIPLKHIEQVITQHPKLIYDENLNQFRGYLEVDENDVYKIEIDLNPFPDSFPLVKEIGERIPHLSDRHIYDSGYCCFTTKANENILLKSKVKTIPFFINEIVVPYFLNQSYYEITGEYKHGEYSHGVSGTIEGYGDILRVKNVWIIYNMLLARSNNYNIGVNDKCYCGSRKKIKKCHRMSYKNFMLIDISIIQKDFVRIHEMLLMAFMISINKHVK